MSEEIKTDQKLTDPKVISKWGMVTFIIVFFIQYIGYMIVTKKVPTNDEVDVMLKSSSVCLLAFSPIFVSMWIKNIGKIFGGVK